MNVNDNKSRILFPDLDFDHSVNIQIRFSDYDTFGHINNNSYMAFLDVGKTDFFRNVLGKNALPSELSAVIVNINVDFLAPALAGEPLAVKTAVVSLGEKSFSLYQRIVNPENDSIKVQATSILAGFDIASQCAAPLSPALLAVLPEFLKRHA